ncbi:MAG TPA: ankyrin repeat domain-containing protein, partial [Candidatus Babeliaceae bacterium]|nr:ankyrin repeat domain-containing protein [Candidatus Babeliaceae bacterium]
MRFLIFTIIFTFTLSSLHAVRKNVTAKGVNTSLSNPDEALQLLLKTSVARKTQNIRRIKKYIESQNCSRKASSEEEFLTVLLELGAKVNPVLTKQNPKSPLLLASSRDNSNFVRILLEYGASPLGPDDFNNRTSALHIAASHHHVQSVELLLQAGALVNTVSSSGHNIIQGAVMVNSSEQSFDKQKTLALLLSYNAPIPEGLQRPTIFPTIFTSNILRCCALGNLNTIDQDKEINFLSYYETDNFCEMTGLHWAAARGHEDIVKFLLKSNLAITNADSEGNTATDLALRNNHQSIVKLLQEKGGILNTQSTI